MNNNFTKANIINRKIVPVILVLMIMLLLAGCHTADSQTAENLAGGQTAQTAAGLQDAENFAVTGDNQNGGTDEKNPAVTGDNQNGGTDKKNSAVTGDNQNGGTDEKNPAVTGDNQNGGTDENNPAVTGDNQNGGTDEKNSAVTGDNQNGGTDENNPAVTGDNQNGGTDENNTAVTEAGQNLRTSEETTELQACGTGKSNSHEIVCFGDSNTYGFDPNTRGRYPEELIWTTQLSEMLGGEYEVINAGLNGRATGYGYPDNSEKNETTKSVSQKENKSVIYGSLTSSGLNGLKALQEYLSEHKTAGVFIFMLGTNDIINGGLSAEETAAGMETLITEVIELSAVACGWNPKIILVAPPVLDENLCEQVYGHRAEAQAEASRQLAPLYKKLAEKYNCIFLDASNILEVSDIDAVHLTPKGHATLADSLYKVLKPILAK